MGLMISQGETKQKRPGLSEPKASLQGAAERVLGISQIHAHSGSNTGDVYKKLQRLVKNLNLNREDWKMQDAITTIQASFRMEMMGAGFYQTLAKQCRRRDSSLSRSLRRFSEQEAMHGRLFKEYAKNQFGRQLRTGFFWHMVGRLTAVLMRPVSLEHKLKKLHGIEQAAVEHIEEILAEGGQSGYRQIFQVILPHEKAHAALYAQVFSGAQAG